MSDLKAGASKLDITPPVGIELAGYTPRVRGSIRSTGVNDRLWVRCLAIADRNQAALLLELDLLGIELATTRQLRSQICQQIPVLPGHVLIGCTHNHSGPSILTEHETHVRVDPGWKALVLDAAVDAAQRALYRLQPAEFGFGRVRVSSVGANRKAVLDDGTLFHFSGLYGRQAPAGRAVVEEGPVDPDLSVLWARDRSGNMIALLASYACHPWLYNGNQISSEIAGACASFLEDRLEPSNPGVVALYAPGTGSDITTVQYQTPMPEGIEAKEAWYIEERQRLGAILGQAALQAVETTKDAIVDGAVSAKTIPLEAPAYPHTLSETRERYGFLPPPGEIIHTELQVLEFGDVVLVGLPTEVYVEYGLEIKDRSKLPRTMVLSYCNDYFADLITSQAVEEGNCPELEWTRVHPDVRRRIMDSLEQQGILGSARSA